MATEDRLKTLVRNVSRSRMEQSAGVTLRLAEIQRPPAVFSHWMALILVTHPSLKILFGVHFKTAEARAMAAKIYRKPAAEVQSNQAIDFMREYCNLVAGGVKAAMQKINLQMAISLPVITRGFDHIVLNDLVEKNSMVEAWQLESPSGKLACTSHVNLFQSVDFSQLGQEATPSSSAGGVEFL